MNNTTPPKLGAWTLRAILDKRTFLVPDFQRGYAWSNRGRDHQLVEFWDDLQETPDNGRHYMGALVVESSDGLFEVVDGQQRLTTLALLLSVLDSSSVGWLRYADGSADCAMLDALLAQGPSSATPAPANVYQRNLVEARAFFEENVRELDAVKRAALRDKCLDCLVFDFSVLGADLDSGVVFETMNNRGKPLTLLEKLKNRLMYLETLVSDEESEEGDDAIDLRRTVFETWGEIYQALGSNPNRDPLDEDEFVAAHLSLYRNPKESTYSPAVAESRLFKMFSPNPERHPLSERIDEHDREAMEKAKRNRGNMEPDLSIGNIEEYVADLRSFAPVWASIHDEFDTPCGRCRLLSGTRETRVFLASVALNVGDEDLRNRIYAAAETILFRNTIRGVMDEGTLTMLGRRLHGKCLSQLKGEDAQPLDGAGMLAALEEALGDERRRIDADTLVRIFAERMDRQQTPYGFYGWGGLKYFLFTQEGTDGFPWSRFEESSLEHVVPQSATADRYDGWWRNAIRDFAPDSDPARWAALNENGRKACRKRKRTLVNTLGNFVLLTQSENASISDDPWDSYTAVEGSHAVVEGKKSFYEKHGRNGNNGAKEVGETNGSWNAFRVLERGRQLFKNLADRLGVTGLTERRIDEALGFDPDEQLSDTQFEPLPESEVSRLAPRSVPGGSAPRVQRNATIRRAGIEDEKIRMALDAMSSLLHLPVDPHNSLINLERFSSGSLCIRFTKHRPHVVWNLWVADKQSFAERYGASLVAWALDRDLVAKLGQKHGIGNGIQFKPRQPIDLEHIDCATMKETGDMIMEKLRSLT